MAVRLVLLATVAGVAVAAGVESFHVITAVPGFSAPGAAPFGPAMLLLAGWAAVATGLAQLWFAPARRSWTLLIAAGLVLFVANWDSPAAAFPALFSFGLLLHAALPAVITHLAFGFPSGRLTARVERAVVAGGYAITVGVLGLAVAMTFDPRSSGCGSCPANLWLVDGDPQLSSQLARFGLRAGLTWSGVVVLVLVWRLMTASTARRRTAGPIWTVAIADLLAITGSYQHGLQRGFVGSDAVQARLWLAQAAALLLISAAALLALVRSRHSQRSLAHLVTDLASAAHPGELRVALAQRLGDPELTIAYPVDGGQRHVDPDGHNVDLTRLRHNRTHTSLIYDRSEIAVLVHRPGILDTPDAVAELVSAVHLALDNERLRAEALTQLADLQSSGSRILTAGDEERRQLERDLHDGAQQRLLGLALALRLLRTKATTASKHLAAAEREVHDAIAELRRVARGLYPVVLRESGLAVALAALAERRMLRIGDMPQTRYPPGVEATVYRLVALASERSPANVSIADHDATITVHVDVEGELPDLTEVRDRTATLNGQLTLSAGEASTRITLVLPKDPGVSTANDQLASPRRPTSSTAPEP